MNFKRKKTKITWEPGYDRSPTRKRGKGMNPGVNQLRARHSARAVFQNESGEKTRHTAILPVFVGHVDVPKRVQDNLIPGTLWCLEGHMCVLTRTGHKVPVLTLVREPVDHVLGEGSIAMYVGPIRLDESKLVNGWNNMTEKIYSVIRHVFIIDGRQYIIKHLDSIRSV